jgi:hypothetical protein
MAHFYRELGLISCLWETGSEETHRSTDFHPCSEFLQVASRKYLNLKGEAGLSSWETIGH